MATYKQRTPYQRHTATHSEDEDQQAVQASGTFKQASSAHTANLASQHLYSNSHYQSTDDDLLESSSNREWTSIRNSSASARAKARQQQYLDQQEQRTREWQFVLSQHHLHSHTTSRDISSDEYDDDLSVIEAPSVVTSPGATDPATGITGASNSGEHSSFFGLSDLASDGVESVGESSDLGVWSHEDEEDTLSLSTSTFRRLPSFPLASSSLAASLSHIPRPSFASTPHHGGSEPRFQNQMPFHDGSGNFFTARSVRSNLESDVDSERGWESSSSRASSVLRSYRSNPRPASLQRRVSISEFKAVIENIVDLQHTNDSSSVLRHSSVRHCPPSSSSQSRGVENGYLVPSSEQPRFTYPSVVTRRRMFDIYESDMEDMADMVDVPAKMGWLQTFEHVLRTLQPNEYNIRVSDPTVLNPIKALAHLSSEDTTDSVTEARESVTQEQATTAQDDTHPASSAEAVHSTSMALQQVKQNMASASLETMQRLQTRKRTHPRRRFPTDPMQVEFSPTVRSQHAFDDVAHHRKERRTTSRSTGTSTSSNNKNLRESSLIAVVISTLRRFRDHVHSNLLHADFDDEEDRHADLARSLGFDGDLGIEWTRAVGNQDGIHGGGGSTTGGDRGRDRDRDQHHHRRHERTPSYTSTASRSSSQHNVRRVNSDCGLESMKHYIHKDHHHPIHRPSLV